MAGCACGKVGNEPLAACWLAIQPSARSTASSMRRLSRTDSTSAKGLAGGTAPFSAAPIAAAGRNNAATKARARDNVLTDLTTAIFFQRKSFPSIAEKPRPVPLIYFQRLLLLSIITGKMAEICDSKPKDVPGSPMS